MRKWLAVFFVLLLLVPLASALYFGEIALFFVLLVFIVIIALISGFFGWSTGK